MAMASKKSVSKGPSAPRRKTAATKPALKFPPAAAPVERRGFPVVGIGASAGGLEALEKFFVHIAPGCGMAFVVVTHQHPAHTSLLPELLRKQHPDARAGGGGRRRRRARLRLHVAPRGLPGDPERGASLDGAR